MTIIWGIFLCLVSSVIFPIFKRWLADRALFWVRVPERFAVMVMKDRGLRMILMCIADQKKRADLMSIIKESDNPDLFKFVKPGQIVWIGCPWFGNTIFEWFEMSEDKINPETDPHCMLDLMERIWDYAADETDEDELKAYNSTWGVDTADPIQISPKMVVEVEVINPQKTVFNVTYFHEAINKKILVAWKKAVEGFYYLRFINDEDGEKKELQIIAQDKLNFFLGFTSKIGGERIIKGCKYSSLSPVGIIYRDYGIWVKRVEIRDIDPTDPNMREAIQKKFQAKTQAAADIETAKGKKEAKKIVTDGETYNIHEVGKATAKASEMQYLAKATGLKKIGSEMNLEKAEMSLLLTTEMSVKMMENADYTYLSGQPGDVGAWAMAAVDRMKGGLDKIQSGNKLKAEIGFDTIKSAWKSLTKAQRDDLLQASIKAENKVGEQ